MFLLTSLSKQGGAGQGRRLVRWMAAGWDCGYSKTLEWVGVGVRVGWAVWRQVTGVAGLLLCGGGAVVAAFKVGHDLRGAGGLGGGSSCRQRLRTGGVPHWLWRRGRGVYRLSDSVTGPETPTGFIQPLYIFSETSLCNESLKKYDKLIEAIFKMVSASQMWIFLSLFGLRIEPEWLGALETAVWSNYSILIRQPRKLWWALFTLGHYSDQVSEKEICWLFHNKNKH